MVKPPSIRRAKIVPVICGFAGTASGPIASEQVDGNTSSHTSQGVQRLDRETIIGSDGISVGRGGELTAATLAPAIAFWVRFRS